MKILTFLPEFPLKKLILPSLLLMVSSASMIAGDKNVAPIDRQSYKIYVDKQGVMRRSDTKQEITNFTYRGKMARMLKPLLEAI